MLEVPTRRSFFLFGPRGVGKTAWLRARFPDAPTFDLLDDRAFARLVASPTRLGDDIPDGYDGLVVIDEIQRVPHLLNEVHRLIESRGIRFALTGSSARKLRGRGVNLLAGRALTKFMHPLTAAELGADFDWKRASRWGTMPLACTSDDPAAYLHSYVGTYLREEIREEGLTRSLPAFFRFLEAASFSQASVLNMAAVARDCAVSGKAAQEWFGVLEDLLIAVRLPAFVRRAKRKLASHPKFFFFDAGVFHAIRPRGPLDTEEQIHGPALETLFLAQVRAVNDYRGLGYALHYWRSHAGDEVDFVLYGERGLKAFEVMRSDVVRREDLKSLLRFGEDYPEAKLHLLHLGTERRHERGVEILPYAEVVSGLERWI
jgi:predicted AAA+ superfamily ATPase